MAIEGEGDRGHELATRVPHIYFFLFSSQSNKQKQLIMLGPKGKMVQSFSCLPITFLFSFRGRECECAREGRED